MVESKVGANIICPNIIVLSALLKIERAMQYVPRDI
jgi:hypothetical protein